MNLANRVFTQNGHDPVLCPWHWGRRTINVKMVDDIFCLSPALLRNDDKMRSALLSEVLKLLLDHLLVIEYQ